MQMAGPALADARIVLSPMLRNQDDMRGRAFSLSNALVKLGEST